jgi:hypothetical protein
MIAIQFTPDFTQNVFLVLGYIDPGILSMALQAFFVFLFGAMATFLVAPWKRLASLFRRKKEVAADGTGQSATERDGTIQETQRSS